MSALFDLLTKSELALELDAAMLELDAQGEVIVRQREQIATLKEVLRRYYTLEKNWDGIDELYAEFGQPEYPESSICMTAWFERVLRQPARVALSGDPVPHPVPQAGSLREKAE
jgi:Ribonuclease G/E